MLVACLHKNGSSAGEDGGIVAESIGAKMTNCAMLSRRFGKFIAMNYNVCALEFKLFISL